ncbi:MAG: zf-HC2 domain-containing protein [Sporichthyaceae bacterium]
MTEEHGIPAEPTGHEPEAAASAYLAGDGTAEQRSRFETHLLGCEECWFEVRTAREGRAAAESLRESAPQAAREYLRTLASHLPEAAEPTPPPPTPAPRRGRHRFALAAGVVAAALLVGGIGTQLWSGAETLEETLVVAEQAVRIEPAVLDRTQPPPLREFGGFTWQGSALRTVGEREAKVHRYLDPAGAEVLLISSPDLFPRAKAAATVSGTKWTAAISEGVVFCVGVHDGVSWLVVGQTRDAAVAAGRAAGLA